MKNLHIRATHDPETGKTKYYFGYTELFFVGYSELVNGYLYKSKSLKQFIKRMGL